MEQEERRSHPLQPSFKEIDKLGVCLSDKTEYTYELPSVYIPSAGRVMSEYSDANALQLKVIDLEGKLAELKRLRDAHEEEIRQLKIELEDARAQPPVVKPEVPQKRKHLPLKPRRVCKRRQKRGDKTSAKTSAKPVQRQAEEVASEVESPLKRPILTLSLLSFLSWQKECFRLLRRAHQTSGHCLKRATLRLRDFALSVKSSSNSRTSNL